jgi:hypothetical protein
MPIGTDVGQSAARFMQMTGGSATHAGIGFQDRVAGLLAVLWSAKTIDAACHAASRARRYS